MAAPTACLQQSASTVAHCHLLGRSAAQWDDVRQLLGPPLGDPVVATPGAPLSPFGTVRIYGYPGVVFQVLESNLLHSVTLYRAS